ncbi:unnamed protein product [Albugo candida]|uniref:WRKY19-like zinc finger domain-containing protein n=1 Tax=Albugo candida TaxID=65357 RepID=A0A024GEZ9_9STRA|nr:unnamed protein product [Albugo candida]|eukprot:CCI45115.1 unnamed protein product [Albugo candida]
MEVDGSVGMKGAINTSLPAVYVVHMAVEDDVRWTDATAALKVVVFVMSMVVVVDVNNSIAPRVRKKEDFVSLTAVAIDAVCGIVKVAHAKTGGFCIAHGGGKRCSVEGCKSSAQRIGLCKAHGGGRKCNEANCHNSAVSRGKCIAHGGGKRCATEGCNTTARKGGFCFAHGNRFKEYGELESPHSTPIEALTEETMFPRPRLPSISEILRLDRKLCGSVWHEKLPPLRRNSDVETFNGSKPVSNAWESQRATVAERMENVCGYSYNGGRGVENRQLDMEGQARSSLRMLISAVLCN